MPQQKKMMTSNATKEMPTSLAFFPHSKQHQCRQHLLLHYGVFQDQPTCYHPAGWWLVSNNVDIVINHTQRHLQWCRQGGWWGVRTTRQGCTQHIWWRYIGLHCIWRYGWYRLQQWVTLVKGQKREQSSYTCQGWWLQKDLLRWKQTWTPFRGSMWGTRTILQICQGC